MTNHATVVTNNEFMNYVGNLALNSYLELMLIVNIKWIGKSDLIMNNPVIFSKQ